MQITKNSLTLAYSEKNGTYAIRSKGFQWVNQGRRPYIIIRKKIGKKYCYTLRTFRSAQHKEASCSENSITVKYSGFTAFGKKLPFTLICTCEITGDNTVSFALEAAGETGLDIYAAYFPGPFNAKERAGETYGVDTMRQGFLMPDGFKKNFLSTLAFAHYPRRINTGDCYLPFWGRVSGKQGYCAIIETPYDASMFSCFGRHGAFLNSVHWRSSLGQLRYKRKIKYVFHDDCDYNTIAKDYRLYLKEQNRLITIMDKIKTNPSIQKLAGAPVLHSRILFNIHPKSHFYKKGGGNRTLAGSFGERAEQYQKFKNMGLEKLYIHTDGWGEQGYDNNHPYVLPPCPEAGGWEGMKALSDSCRQLGYVFALHDQYRDYYYSSKKFDMAKAITELDGTHPYCDYWDGGPHTWLCASKAPEYVKNTYTELETHGVDIQGAYLDVFSIVAGDECFHPDHKITREESIQYRGACFDYLTGKGIIPSSEEPGGLLIDKLALVHHGPYTLRPQENGAAVGIPVPILNLVYHDCIMLPWLTDGKGGWGIPKGEKASLHCILNAGMPYFRPYKDNDKPNGQKALLSDEEIQDKIICANKLAEIQGRLYDKEMVAHRFLNQSCRTQQVTYSDGTVITVDFDKDTYDIQWGEEHD